MNEEGAESFACFGSIAIEPPQEASRAAMRMERSPRWRDERQTELPISARKVHKSQPDY